MVGLRLLESHSQNSLILASLVKANLVGLRGLEPPTLRLSGVRSNHLSYKPMRYQDVGLWSFLPPFGGDEENRTPDPLLARQVLSQLSYTPIFSTGLGSNSVSLFTILKVHLFRRFHTL